MKYNNFSCDYKQQFHKTQNIITMKLLKIVLLCGIFGILIGILYTDSFTFIASRAMDVLQFGGNGTYQQIAHTRKLLYEKYGGRTEWKQYQYYWQNVSIYTLYFVNIRFEA